MKIGTDGVAVGALATVGASGSRVLDAGAGCGLISLMLAQRFPHAIIDAVELDEGAFTDMKENIAHSPWCNRIKPILGDYAAVEGKYDLIVSNPPYYIYGEKSADERRASARHAGGLSPMSLTEFAATHLTEHGLLAMILPAECAAEIIGYAAFKRLSLRRRIDISTSPRRGITRTYLEFSRNTAAVPQISKLAIGSDEFKELTKDFYLNY